jgi:3',5'-cyclic AMP phosphodiesterase CpdA
MARILHLSDLHFGAHDPRLVEGVEVRVAETGADLVVISGDFTQRARTDQFKEACEFLTRLRDGGHEVLAVPGNHDVPLYDVLRRFLSPLTRYRRYINDDLCPYHELRDAAVLGINTARSLTFKDGHINEEQIAYIRDSFAKVKEDTPRILVTHHPLFALPVGDGAELGHLMDDQQDALGAIADAGVDLLLAGHNHRASTNLASDLVTRAGSALVVQAGTATSTRVRDEEQSFNLIEIAPADVTVTVQAWDGSAFTARDAQRYRREGEVWRLEKGVTAGASAETAAVA